MSDLGNYFKAQTETRLARQEYETASVKIELCQIRERRAECISQHEPLCRYNDRPLTRQELIEIIDYIVLDRKCKP